MRTAFEKNWWKGLLPGFGGVPASVAEAWSPGAKWFTLRKVRRVQSQIEELLPVLLRGKKLRVLDVGCGIGDHMLAIRYLGHEVFGVDCPPPVNQFYEIQRHLPVPVCMFVLGEDKILPFEKGSFDVVMCLSVLQLRKLNLGPKTSAILEDFARLLCLRGQILTGWWRDQSIYEKFILPGFSCNSVKWKTQTYVRILKCTE